MRIRTLAVLVSVLLAYSAAAGAQREKLPSAPSPPDGFGHAQVFVNGRPYVRPTQRDLFENYASDTYGLPGAARTLVRAGYGQARGKPDGWGQDWPGFGQRLGSSVAVTAINGTVRYGFENLFHEDLRYIPCHGCRWKQKVENALLAEITARHESDGRRVFSLTPTIADMSGPIITHTLWYPGASSGPEEGAVTARTVFVTRIGGHLFREFVWERRHHDEPGTMGTERH